MLDLTTFINLTVVLYMHFAMSVIPEITNELEIHFFRFADDQHICNSFPLLFSISCSDTITAWQQNHHEKRHNSKQYLCFHHENCNNFTRELIASSPCLY